MYQSIKNGFISVLSINVAGLSIFSIIGLITFIGIVTGLYVLDKYVVK